MSDAWKTEYDHRQYGAMAVALQQYEDGTINLPSLVSGLESLLACLEAADQNWVERFRSEWWTLEQVYAVAIDRGQTDLSAEEVAEVGTAIANLRHILTNRLAVQVGQGT